VPSPDANPLTMALRWRGTCAAALAVLALSTAVVPSTAAACASLARRLTLTGDRTGWVAVDLPRSINPYCPSDPGCAAKAALRLSDGAFGYALQYEADTATRPAPSAVVLRLPKAQGGRVVAVVSGTDPRTGSDSSETGRLPAGRYRLFLLTNGRGAVSVQFPELAGKTLAVRPGRSTAYRAAEISPDYAGPLAPSAWASGITVQSVPERSHGYAFLWTDGPAAATSLYGGCVYDGGEPPQGRWVPGCPGGQSLMANQLMPATNCCGTAYAMVVSGGGTRFSFGQYYVQGGPVTKAGMFIVWFPDR
jgi:hypothetical protein